MQKGAGHWPFSTEAPGAHAGKLPHEGDESQGRAHDQAMQHQHGRTNRLIVGGRAHVKKAGLS